MNEKFDLQRVAVTYAIDKYTDKSKSTTDEERRDVRVCKDGFIAGYNLKEDKGAGTKWVKASDDLPDRNVRVTARWNKTDDGYEGGWHRATRDWLEATLKTHPDVEWLDESQSPSDQSGEVKKDDVWHNQSGPDELRPLPDATKDGIDELEEDFTLTFQSQLDSHTLALIFSWFRAQPLPDGGKIDLNKIEKRLDDALATETPESMREWLKGQRKSTSLDWDFIELDFLAEFEGEEVNPITIINWFRSRPEFQLRQGDRVAVGFAEKFTLWCAGKNYHRLNGTVVYVQTEESPVKQYTVNELLQLYKLTPEYKSLAELSKTTK